ncbi:unnamed protein product [Trichogramma brassicae]|uniref:Uncharacterized protein n=1 Tax=Trichogramma brassicae TaxID=86971 RepID=A0A6H5IZ45_9HYME|nr:unnamed protein product [Trichogramma brassicae]
MSPILTRLWYVIVHAGRFDVCTRVGSGTRHIYCHVGRKGPTSDAARDNESDEHSSSATAVSVHQATRRHLARTVSNVSKADDELMKLLARINNYVKSRNQGHSGYNGQAAYNQYNRGYEAPTQPSSDLSLVRHDAHTEYPTGRVPCTPSSFRLFNDIVKQIPKFDGKPNTLKLFCTAVEEAVEQLPFFEQKIVRALQPKLVGDAQYIVGNEADYQNAQELLRDLQDRFRQ